MAFFVNTYSDESALLTAIQALQGQGRQLVQAEAKRGKYTLVTRDTSGADGVGAVQTFESPQDLADYLNTITLPARYAIVNKGYGKFTFVSDTAPAGGSGTLVPNLLDSISKVQELMQIDPAAILTEYGGKLLGLTETGIPQAPVQNLVLGAGGASYEWTWPSLEENKPPVIRKAWITGTPVAGQTLTANALVRNETIYTLTLTYQWVRYTAGGVREVIADENGQTYDQVVEDNNYRVTCEITPTLNGGANPVGATKTATPIGVTSGLNVPFGDVAPDGWAQFANWDDVLKEVANQGDLGGVFETAATFNDPTQIAGGINIDALGNNELLTGPFKSTNIPGDGELTAFVDFQVLNGGANAGIMTFDAVNHFQKRSADWQLRAPNNSNFGSSDLNRHVAIIRIKPGANLATVEIDFSGTEVAQVNGTPGNIGNATSLLFGATATGSTNQGDLNLYEAIYYFDGKYNPAWYNDARTYFGF